MTTNNSQYKCNCWHGVHCGISCMVSGCDCTDCQCAECLGPLSEPVKNPDQYDVFPDDDGTDGPRNPYSPV